MIQNVPAEVIPEWTSGLTLCGSDDSPVDAALPTAALAHVDGHGAIIEHANALAALFASWNLIDILLVPCPHLPELANKLHRTVR